MTHFHDNDKTFLDDKKHVEANIKVIESKRIFLARNLLIATVHISI